MHGLTRVQEKQVDDTLERDTHPKGEKTVRAHNVCTTLRSCSTLLFICLDEIGIVLCYGTLINS